MFDLIFNWQASLGIYWISCGSSITLKCNKIPDNLHPHFPLFEIYGLIENAFQKLIDMFCITFSWNSNTLYTSCFLKLNLLLFTDLYKVSEISFITDHKHGHTFLRHIRNLIQPPINLFKSGPICQVKQKDDCVSFFYLRCWNRIAPFHTLSVPHIDFILSWLLFLLYILLSIHRLIRSSRAALIAIFIAQIRFGYVFQSHIWGYISRGMAIVFMLIYYQICRIIFNVYRILSFYNFLWIIFLYIAFLKS